ncbi:MAG: heat-inducible transcriptional repressor HrcA [Chloroflexota bacterium]|nr:heat-inducible transcriptional repressor HrcA [Chloroflexota bacterium]
MTSRAERPVPLDQRAQAILRAVIEEYIETASPVGSHALVERRRLAVSPATVRNVMAELEQQGYLSHPHTSAGRVPTDAGYRLYVEAMADRVDLAPVEQLMIRHQFGQVEFASEQWFRLAAAILAGATRNAGLATPAKPRACRVRRIDLVLNSSRMASLVLVLAEGSVKQGLLPLDEQIGQEQLDEIAQRLNEELAGASARQVAQRLDGLRAAPGLPPLLHMAGVRIERMMREFDAAAVEDVFSDGLLNVLAAPEFAHSEKLRRIFGVLQNREYLGRLLERVAGQPDVQVLIGSDTGQREMQDVSLVLAGYGRPGRAMGVVGVLGPTRMAYPQAIGSVRYVSGLMNELVEQLYR